VRLPAEHAEGEEDGREGQQPHERGEGETAQRRHLLLKHGWLREGWTTPMTCRTAPAATDLRVGELRKIVRRQAMARAATWTEVL
jgi:hypothetical protein